MSFWAIGITVTVTGLLVWLLVIDLSAQYSNRDSWIKLMTALGGFGGALVALTISLDKQKQAERSNQLERENADRTHFERQHRLFADAIAGISGKDTSVASWERVIALIEAEEPASAIAQKLLARSLRIAWEQLGTTELLTLHDTASRSFRRCLELISADGPSDKRFEIVLKSRGYLFQNGLDLSYTTIPRNITIDFGGAKLSGILDLSQSIVAGKILCTSAFELGSMSFAGSTVHVPPGQAGAQPAVQLRHLEAHGLLDSSDMTSDVVDIEPFRRTAATENAGHDSRPAIELSQCRITADASDSDAAYINLSGHHENLKFIVRSVDTTNTVYLADSRWRGCELTLSGLTAIGGENPNTPIIMSGAEFDQTVLTLEEVADDSLLSRIDSISLRRSSMTISHCRIPAAAQWTEWRLSDASVSLVDCVTSVLSVHTILDDSLNSLYITDPQPGNQADLSYPATVDLYVEVGGALPPQGPLLEVIVSGKPVSGTPRKATADIALHVSPQRPDDRVDLRRLVRLNAQREGSVSQAVIEASDPDRLWVNYRQRDLSTEEQ